MFRKHPAQFRQDVMGQHAVFAVDGGGTVGGGTMQVHCTGGSLIGGQAAGQQGGGHARQHVPAAATGKAGVAGGVHAHPAVRGRA